jgi:hypothetical protein
VIPFESHESPPLVSATECTPPARAKLSPGVILVRDRLDMNLAMEAGRAWQRLHLGATAEGLAAQPLNQPVECTDRSAMVGKNDSFGRAIVKLVATPGWEPTFVFRLGSLNGRRVRARNGR